MVNRNFEELTQAPALNQIFGDPATREFALASIFFLEHGTANPKPVYRRTSDTSNDFTPISIIQLDATGAIPYDIWFYTKNEADPSQNQTYDILVKRASDSVTIYSRVNYPFIKNGSQVEISVNYRNLFPSFDYPINDVSNQQNTLVQINPYFPCPGWAVYSNRNDSNTFINFKVNSDPSIKGAPGNLLNVISSPVAANAGIRYVGAINIGFFNIFAGKKFKIHNAFVNNNTGNSTLQYVLVRIDQTTDGSKEEKVTAVASFPITNGISGSMITPGLNEVDTVINIAANYPNTNLDSRVGLFVSLSDTTANYNLDITANYLQKIENDSDPLNLELANFSKNVSASLFNNTYADFTNFTNPPVFDSNTPAVLVNSPEGVKTYSVCGSYSYHDTFTGATLTNYPSVPFSTSNTSPEFLYLNQNRNGGIVNNLLIKLRNAYTLPQFSFKAVKTSDNSLHVIPLGTVGTISKTDWASSSSAITVTITDKGNVYNLTAQRTANVVTIEHGDVKFSTAGILSHWGGFTPATANRLPISTANGGIDSNGVGLVKNYFDHNASSGAPSFFETFSPGSGTPAITVAATNNHTATLTFNSATQTDYIPGSASTQPSVPSSEDAFKYYNFLAITYSPIGDQNNTVKPYTYGSQDQLSPIGAQIGAYFSIDGNLNTKDYVSPKNELFITTLPIGTTTAESIATTFVNNGTKLGIFGGGTQLATVTVNSIPTHNSYITFADRSATTPKKYAVVFADENQVPSIPTSGTFDRVFYLKISANTTQLTNDLVDFFKFCVQAIPTYTEWTNNIAASSGFLRL